MALIRLTLKSTDTDRNSLPSARRIKNYFGFMYLDVMSPFLQSNAWQVANNNMPGLDRNVSLFLSFVLCKSNFICSTNFLVFNQNKIEKIFSIMNCTVNDKIKV